MKHVTITYFKYLCLAALIYIPIFGFLNTFPIRLFDESRLANNAYEMLKNGDFIVTHYKGIPDMFNTRPPLMIWLQVLSMKFIGVNELSVRLPAAFATLFTCIALLMFSLKYLKDFWFGFIAVIVLITSYGYVCEHVTRTGDYEALLIQFTTLSALLFFAFIETKKNKFLYLFFVITALAVLTKSVAGLLFMPALLIYSLIQKQFWPTLKNKHFYFGIMIFAILTLGYYLLRQFQNPGYLRSVYNNELGGRYLNILEGPKQGFWYYFSNIINFQLYPVWYLLIPCGLIVGLVNKDSKIKRITLFSSLVILSFFLIISTAQTKLRHYDAPMYPFIAILIAVFIYYIFNLLKNWELINKTLKINILPFIFLFIITIIPYKNVMNYTYKPKEYAWAQEFYEIGYFLQDAVKGKYDVDDYFILYDGHYANLRFYMNILNDRGVDISFKNWKNLQSGDLVIVCQNNVKQYVEEHYDLEKIEEIGNVIKYRIITSN
ncbi:MAG: glycosyltransferase family 39 protein [Saprospiraceae bacterium]|nr:glycosyltransferase family 39 protein [Saprospiraceae bacterium]